MNLSPVWTSSSSSFFRCKSMLRSRLLTSERIPLLIDLQPHLDFKHREQKHFLLQTLLETQFRWKEGSRWVESTGGDYPERNFMHNSCSSQKLINLCRSRCWVLLPCLLKSCCVCTLHSIIILIISKPWKAAEDLEVPRWMRIFTQLGALSTASVSGSFSAVMRRKMRESNVNNSITSFSLLISTPSQSFLTLLFIQLKASHFRSLRSLPWSSQKRRKVSHYSICHLPQLQGLRFKLLELLLSACTDRIDGRNSLESSDYLSLSLNRILFASLQSELGIWMLKANAYCREL